MAVILKMRRYGLTNCAERTAIFKAVSEGETAFTAIAVVGIQKVQFRRVEHVDK